MFIGKRLISTLVVTALLLCSGAAGFFLLTRSLIPEIKQEIHVQKDPTLILTEIQKEFDIVLASQQSVQKVTGYTQSAVPFSKEEWVYEAVYTVEARIDLSGLTAQDLTVVGDTIYFELPKPTLHLFLDERNSSVLSKDSQPLSGPFTDNNLLKKMQLEARLSIGEKIVKDGKLKAEAIESAKEKLTTLLGASGFKVVFSRYYGPFPEAKPSPKPSSL